jgi:hypothetical protein
MQKKILHIGILLILSALPFVLSLSYPLLEGWDDHIYVRNNVNFLSFSFENILHWLKTPCEGTYLPLTMLSFMADYELWGLNGFGYHLQNLFWHLAAVAGVYAFFRAVGMHHLTSFLCALFFAVHPQRAESVVWISERKDVLCAAFYFWALVFFLLSQKKEKAKLFYALSILFAILALLSKAMAASLPFVILFTQIYVMKKPGFKCLKKARQLKETLGKTLFSDEKEFSEVSKIIEETLSEQ